MENSYTSRQQTVNRRRGLVQIVVFKACFVLKTLRMTAGDVWSVQTGITDTSNRHSRSKVKPINKHPLALNADLIFKSVPVTVKAAHIPHSQNKYQNRSSFTSRRKSQSSSGRKRLIVPLNTKGERADRSSPAVEPAVRGTAIQIFSLKSLCKPFSTWLFRL